MISPYGNFRGTYKGSDAIPTLHFRGIERGERIRIQLSMEGHLDGIAITLKRGSPDRLYVYIFRV